MKFIAKKGRIALTDEVNSQSSIQDVPDSRLPRALQKGRCHSFSEILPTLAWIPARSGMRFDARKVPSIVLADEADLLGQFSYGSIYGYDWR